MRLELRNKVSDFLILRLLEWLRPHTCAITHGLGVCPLGACPLVATLGSNLHLSRSDALRRERVEKQDHTRTSSRGPGSERKWPDESGRNGVLESGAQQSVRLVSRRQPLFGSRWLCHAGMWVQRC